MRFWAAKSLMGRYDEGLDHVVLRTAAGLRRILKEYVGY
jgi:hypothetical protein